MQVMFKLFAETKGAGRYSEKLADGSYAKQPNDVGAVIGTLYLRKTAFPQGLPKTLEVTLTPKN